MSAGTIAYAGGPDTPAAASNSRVNISIEGWHARTNDFRSILVVNGATAGKLDAQSKWGWAVNLGYTFDDQSDVTASYRHIKKQNSKAHVYNSVQSLVVTNATAGGVSLTGPTDSLNVKDEGAAAVVGTENFTETGRLTYQQGNVDWGHTFSPVNGFFFRPYVGAAWRSIGYKDTLSFVAKNNAGSVMASADYLSGPLTVVKDTNLLINGNTVVAASTGNAFTALGGNVTLNITNAANIQVAQKNIDYDTFEAKGDDYYLGSGMPSYDSKFTGVGPRFGFDSHYTFGDNFSVVGGLVFSAPYGTQKTKASLWQYTDTNASTGRTKILQGGTTNTYVQNANLRASTIGAAVSYSSSEHKFIPEMELNLGVRMSNDITQGDDMTYFIEAGYRVIHDWNAIKNIDFAAITAVAADDTRGAAFQYEDESDFGPYLKFGMTFGT